MRAIAHRALAHLDGTVALAALVALIARSPIVVPRPFRARPPLPEAFDDRDIAILDWIIADSDRTRRRAWM